MAFAWPANDTASRLFGVPTTWLTHQNSPLIFDYSLDTGLARDKEPYNVRRWGPEEGPRLLKDYSEWLQQTHYTSRATR